MHPTPLPPRDAVPPGRRAECLVVDIGLSCPSCRVQLTLPSAYLGQVVTGPCPACGSILVFCHGRIESAPRPAGIAQVIAVSEPEPPATPGKLRLPRTGTVDVLYLEDQDEPGANQEAGWGAAATGDAATAGLEAAAISRRRRWAWSLGIVVFFAMVGGILWLLSRPAPPPPQRQPSMPGTGGGPRRIPAGWSEGALAAWHAFSQAGTSEEKLAHVLDAKRVAPTLQAFYAEHPGSDEQWADRELKALPGTSDDRRRGLIALGSAPQFPGERPIILFFRLAPAGTPSPDSAHTAPLSDTSAASAPTLRFLLDWETYIQERERLVEAFLNDPTAARRTFRLALERVHVFDDEGEEPRRTEPLALKLRTPSGLILQREARVKPGTALFTRFNEQLRWGQTAYATVQLAWDATTGPPPRLTVSDIVCWHFPGLGGAPEFATDLSPLPPAPSRH